MAILKDLIVQGQTKGLEKIQAPEFVEGGVSLINKYLTSATTPTVNNGYLQITTAATGMALGNFSANQSTNTVVKLHKVVSTGNVGDLTNNAGYITSAVTALKNFATSANVVTALNKKPNVAFKTIKINATNLDADTSADTLTISAGTNVTLTADANNDKFVISSKDTLPGKLTTTATTSLSTATNEPLSGTVSLHKIAKTGNFNDLVNKPENIGQSTVVVRLWQQSGGGDLN